MQEETLSTLISCYQVMLPKALKASRKSSVSKKYDIFYELVKIPEKTTKKQDEIIELFKMRKIIPKKELQKISASSLKTLEANSTLREIKKEHYRVALLEEREEKKPLTVDQEKVVNEFRNSSDKVYLLHGVTGSGKTEVYMELIEDCIKENKTCIVLVPEISLTPQTISRFSKRFGSRIALLHSALSDGERYDEWRRINRGEVDIVIGARSALFAPLKNLGLIVIDEQHSESYKQDDSNPRYDAINMAIKRVELNKGAKVILGSATPTLDAYARALKNIYHLLNLPKRVNKKPLPEVTLVDMNQEFKRSEGHFSLLLLNKIKEKFDIAESDKQVSPDKKGTFGMYLGGKWYKLTAHKDIMSDDPVDGLDVAVLQDNLLAPVLGIGDPKTDKRIDFVGGIRGLGELERRVHTDMKVAFSMYPTSIAELFAVADAGRLMPPKSTWFEPKLRSGLFLHEIER